MGGWSVSSTHHKPIIKSIHTKPEIRSRKFLYLAAKILKWKMNDFVYLLTHKSLYAVPCFREIISRKLLDLL